MEKSNHITVEEMEAFFKDVDFTDDIIQLNECTTVINLKKFVTSHLNALKVNSGKPIFLPYYERLVQVYKLYKL